MIILSFTAFADLLVDELELEPPVELDQSTELVADLGFDSMLFVATLGVLDQLGVVVDDQVLARSVTVGDVYQLYAVAVAAQDDGLVTSP